MQKMKVMTFNIRYAKGMDGKVCLRRVASVIANEKPDVVALQEVDRYFIRSGIRDQIGWLAMELEMHFCFAPSVNLRFCQYGNAFLTRAPIQSVEINYMPGSTERRSVLKAYVSIYERMVSLINTHLGVVMNDRSRQLPGLLKMLKRQQSPAILLGDFNMEMTNPLMKDILDAGWHRISPLKPMATMRNGKEIDHILVNTATSKAIAWVQETDASDHHAVIAEIEWYN